VKTCDMLLYHACVKIMAEAEERMNEIYRNVKTYYKNYKTKQTYY